MAYLNDSAWVFLTKFKFCLRPLPTLLKKTVCAGFQVFLVIPLASDSELPRRLGTGAIFPMAILKNLKEDFQISGDFFSINIDTSKC